MRMRVWHISNVPGEIYRQSVSSIDEAKLVLNTLARHDLYLGDLIHSNAQGLEVFEDGEWVEWEHPETGEDIVGNTREEAEMDGQEFRAELKAEGLAVDEGNVIGGPFIPDGRYRVYDPATNETVCESKTYSGLIEEFAWARPKR